MASEPNVQQLQGCGVKNQGATGSGYSDVLLNVALPGGMRAEIQINTPAMFVARDELGHHL